MTAPSLTVSDHPTDAQRDAWYRRDRGLLRLSREDPHRSLADGERWLAEVRLQSEAEAWALRALSHPLRAVGRYPEALACAERAERRFAELGLADEVARTAAGHVWTLRYLGRYEEAIRIARRAQRYFRARGERLEAARLTNNLGTLFRPAGQLDAARRSFLEAARDFRRCGDLTEEATAVSNLGNVLADLGHYGEAEWAHRRAVRLYGRLGHAADVARAQLNLASVLKRRGDYGRALTTLRASRELATRLDPTNGGAQADLELAQITLFLNLLEEADAASTAARAAFARLGVPYAHAQALLWSAVVAERRGAIDEAAAFAAQARARAGQAGNRPIEALAAVMEVGLGRAGEEGLATVVAAERHLRRLGARDRAAEARLVHAGLLRRLGRLDESLTAYRSAARAIARLDNPDLSYRVNAALGRALESAAPRHALRHYQAAIERLESLRRSARADDLKLALVADKVDVFERAARLLLDGAGQRPDIAAALALVERGKSPSLLEQLLERAEAGNRTTAALGRRLRDLRARLSDAGREAGGGRRRAGGGGRDVARLEQDVTSATRDLQLALRDHSAAAPFDPERLRAVLPAGGVLVEYYSLGDELMCFVLRAERRDRRARVYRGLGGLADAERLASRLSFQVGKGIYGADYLEANAGRLRRTFDNVLGELWRLLVAPLAAEIEGARHLVVVGHGPLHGLPLHAAFDGQRYLADRLGVSYAPSARVFTACAERGPRPIERPLFVGPSDDELPWIAREATELARAFSGGRALAGRRATPAGVRRRAGTFDALHLAAHATFRSDNPRFSELRLTDGSLSVGDLADLCRGVELVTLSACDTGRNRVEAGDELVGLTRAVLGSGAASLLASLWTVHDRASYVFMRQLYAGLRGGLGKAASLEMAMRAVRREWDHPFFWAPFVLSGAV